MDSHGEYNIHFFLCHFQSVQISNKHILVADLLKTRGVDIAPHFRLKKTLVGDKVVSVKNVDIKKYDIDQNVFYFLGYIMTYSSLLFLQYTPNL